MKEIGETLKDARENIGLSLEEVANDLKLRSSQIESIENGNVEAFKDVFYLKSLIKDYAKYLGLNYDEMVDEFNEYLFDHTSRISLDDIKKAKKKASKKEKVDPNRVASPYTIDRRYHFTPKSVLFILVILLVIIATILLFNSKTEQPKEEPKNNQVIGG